MTICTNPQRTKRQKIPICVPNFELIKPHKIWCVAIVLFIRKAISKLMHSARMHVCVHTHMIEGGERGGRAQADGKRICRKNLYTGFGILG